MAILFIADLHLSEKDPRNNANFLYFLQNQASKAKALYILGDFFDYWIGDDDPSELHKIIAQELQSLKNKGVNCYFIHGNRDFLLGKKFAQKSGLTLLSTEEILVLYGHNILILHGDTLCTDDILYQYYRKIVHNLWLQRLFLMLPLSIRNYIAKIIQKNSQYATKLKSEHIIDVNKQVVIAKFKQYKVDWIIHGHTHRSAIHKININGKIFYRAVLGSWQQDGSIIKITNQTIELLNFAFY